jgi:GntR family transcriptional regulator
VINRSPHQDLELMRAVLFGISVCLKYPLTIYISLYILYISYIYNNERSTMDIIITNSSGEPIYMQIVTQIKEQIISGRLQEGEMLPSMRNLAMQLRISVITTKRAYEELEREGFIESYSGRGSFVRAQNMELLREEQLRQIEELLRQAIDKAKPAGISMEELQEIIGVLFKEENDG